MKLLIFVAALVILFASSNGISLFGKDCDDRKSIFNDNSNACAVIYDDDDCDGKSMVIEVGYTKFDSGFKNDAESLMVRAGCVLIGYSNDRGRRGDEFFQGDNAVFNALSRSSSDGPFINKNLDDDELDEDMESCDCYCRSTSGVGNVTEISSLNIEGGGLIDSILGRNRASRCNDQVAIFNRPGPAQPKALVYDEPGCKGRMKEIGSGYTSLSETFGEDLDDDVESVMVRPRCKFEGYDHGRFWPTGRGSSVIIDASRNAREPKAKNLDGEGDLEEEISSIDVTC